MLFHAFVFLCFFRCELENQFALRIRKLFHSPSLIVPNSSFSETSFIIFFFVLSNMICFYL